jgi:hypothetical protein
VWWFDILECRLVEARLQAWRCELSLSWHDNPERHLFRRRQRDWVFRGHSYRHNLDRSLRGHPGRLRLPTLTTLLPVQLLVLNQHRSL